MNNASTIKAPQTLLTEHDVAQLLNVSVATIRRRRLLKQPPFPVKIGASVRYKPEEISRFIDASAGDCHLKTGGKTVTAHDLTLTLGGKRVGNQYMALCPAHDDRNPSLSITEKSGKLLVKCFAGCPQQNVIEELKARGLWEAEPANLSFEQRIERVYDYTDASGKPLYQVVRLHSPKDFRQRYRDQSCHGGWRWKKHPHQVLYRLPEVLKSPIVFLVEGEKDVETLRAWGFVATTNAGGADAAWLPQFTNTLRGREVNIIPDNDWPGWQRVNRIAAALFGHANLRLFKLPSDVKDITEWFERGNAECEFIALLERSDVN